MDKNIIVKQAAERLNIPVETLVSWIEQESLHHAFPNDRDQFIERLEDGEFRQLINYYKGISEDK